jgi:polar amino acid transport system substrate-binding protein
MRPFLACLLLFSCVLTGCGSARSEGDQFARIRAEGVLRVGVKADSPPFGTMVGKNRSGFDLDIAYALGARLGVEKVEFTTVTSADRLDRLKHGEVDLVIASTTRTRSRERDVDFSMPYFEDGQALLVTAGSPIASYLDLAGKRVGVVQGSTSLGNLKQVAPGCIPITVDSFDALAQSLALGRVDAITSDRLILMGLQRRTPALASARLAGEPFTAEPYGIALAENQSRLRKAIDHALMGMWEDGEYQRIRDTWFGTGTSYALPERFALPVYPR